MQVRQMTKAKQWKNYAYAALAARASNKLFWICFVVVFRTTTVFFLARLLHFHIETTTAIEQNGSKRRSDAATQQQQHLSEPRKTEACVCVSASVLVQKCMKNVPMININAQDAHKHRTRAPTHCESSKGQQQTANISSSKSSRSSSSRVSSSNAAFRSQRIAERMNERANLDEAVIGAMLR